VTDLVANAIPALITPLGVVIAVALGRRIIRQLMGA